MSRPDAGARGGEGPERATCVAVVAGEGRLPLAMVRAARRRGWRVVAVAVAGGEHRQLARLAHAFYRVPASRYEEIVELLRREGAARIYWAGKVGTEAILQGRLDSRSARLVGGLPVRTDGALLSALLEDLAGVGLPVGSQAELLADHLASPGVLGRHRPRPEQWADVELGVRVGREIGRASCRERV